MGMSPLSPTCPPTWLQAQNAKNRRRRQSVNISPAPKIFTVSWHELLVTPPKDIMARSERADTHRATNHPQRFCAVYLCMSMSQRLLRHLTWSRDTCGTERSLQPACPHPRHSQPLSHHSSAFFSPCSPSTPFALAFLLLMLLLLLLSKHKLIHRGACVI